MKKSESRRRTISVAQRGQIVQRVIVDGWTSAEAAAAFGVPRRVVEVWVTDFRRYGMASLRQNPGRTIAAEMIRFALGGANS
jgi:transposase-like protein